MDRFVRDFKKSLHNEVSGLKEVSCVEACDVILYFCFIASRAGTDIDAAINRCFQVTDSKPVLLVVIYPTLDPEKIILDSNNSIGKENVYAVDCLFNENDGFLKCQKNKDAIAKTGKYLNPEKLTSYYCLQQEHASPHQINWDTENSPLISPQSTGQRPRYIAICIVCILSFLVVAVIITIYLFVREEK